MPKEVLTPPRDYDPCQDRDAQRHHGPPQDKNTPGSWPTGDPCCNRDTKEKSVRKTCRSKMQLRKTSKRPRATEKMRKQRVIERNHPMWDPILLRCSLPCGGSCEELVVTEI